MIQQVPNSGDIAWLCIEPKPDDLHEERQPVLVLSPADYNLKTGLMLCCPMTTQIKGYPFEVEIDGEAPAAVLADQIRSLDWKVFKAVVRGFVTQAELSSVRLRAASLIGKP
ncbi:type II toxin-antitoxin system PemK/MazF family toxin [Pseudomonas amygdali]|uniref:Toxin ChpA n=2 Tax=Pseudomonas amygdali pv. lachrymans TaxID=53707 RepID=A0ABR5KS28_PSEAV|nr:type II toxin-antitoxin system PemK/MazF family toxin [Pseudomonas amygdali]AXH60218.1 toxin MazF [Pseudomonas amygdali pv. lachrymans str. M301315]KPC17616.1 Toxin ChpA [Pseudomonas amygdali pv. lachrymans]RMT06206.1 Toxin ChpA [Pseudomonas amygdali pv. lachrymans]